MSQRDDKTRLDRRDFLKTVAAASLAAGAVGCDDSTPAATALDASPDASGPDVGAGDVNTPPPDAGAAPSLKPVRGDGTHPFHYIDTLVLVQMENRTFDHYFAGYREEGRSDLLLAPAGWSNPDLDGNAVVARHLDTEYVIDPDPGHGQGASLLQWNNGANDGFVRDWVPLCQNAGLMERVDWVMGYHTRADLPIYYGLADAFTTYDHWHSALLGPTMPNRYYSYAATSEGRTSNDGTIKALTPYTAVVNSGFTVGLYADNIVHTAATLEGFPHSHPNVTYNTSLDPFFEQAEAGTLPNVCILDPDFLLNDDHPPQDVRLGQAFVGSIYEALRNSPQWDRTLFILFYDEHGGFADHVPPPDAKGEPLAGTVPGKNFTKLGFRIPGLAVGPLVGRGMVVSETIEHASIPKLVRDIFTPNANYVNERASLAGDLGLSLNLELTLDANRPVAPTMPEVSIPQQKIELAINAPNGQPELTHYHWLRYGLRPAEGDALRHKADRWLRRLQRMRVARVS